MRKFIVTVASCLFALSVFAQGNGKLQLHFIDVGQGMGALLISPGGETVLFDDGLKGNCDLPVSYIQQLGVTRIDYHVNSHYHADHLGCAAAVFAEAPLQKTAYDRGTTIRTSGMNTASYRSYVTAIGNKRKTATKGEQLVLDANAPSPVTITFVALNGNGVVTENENDLSLVAKVEYEDFDAELGGDLSGFETGNYEDIETSVAPLVGQVEVYSVHHHGSRYSSNDFWLDTIAPRVGIISAGDGNDYGHPTQACLDRLHAHGIMTYWTERGAGAPPDPDYDTVAGNIIVEVAPGAREFTVTSTLPGGATVTYPTWEASSAPTDGTPAITFAWSKKSNIYHFSTCKYVANISPGNLMEGAVPPANKTLHNGCPK